MTTLFWELEEIMLTASTFRVLSNKKCKYSSVNYMIAIISTLCYGTHDSDKIKVKVTIAKAFCPAFCPHLGAYVFKYIPVPGILWKRIRDKYIKLIIH
jgi:hypothetical protein